MLADKLNMGVEEAECWIVNLIRNARLDAKIDLKLGHVVMGTQPLSPYQQLLEKVDSLSVRSEALQALIERKLKAKNQDVSSLLSTLELSYASERGHTYLDLRQRTLELSQTLRS
jgi:translation initiation factor 3 subunit E